MADDRRGGECSILVVDDDPDIREMLCELIQEEVGCAPYSATNGREAIEVLPNIDPPPCLILLDMMMPLMNGPELLGFLGKDEAYAKIPVTIITAAPGTVPETSGGVLFKPFTADALRLVVRSHCTARERGPREHDLSRIASMLREQKEELIQEWMDRVRKDPKIPQSDSLDEEQFRNNIPDLIDALVASLSQSAQSGGESGADAHQIGGEAAARMHAHHRLEEKYTLVEELRELSHLRAVFIDICTKEGIVLRDGEAKLVHAVLDELMTTAAHEVEKTTSEDLRRDVALRELFTAILGHDLRTPLSSIVLASSKLLQREDLPENVTRDHRRIAANAERMKRLIEDLLDTTRVRHNGLPVAPRPTDLRPLCDHVLSDVRQTRPDVAVELQAPASVPGKWDPDRMTQLLQNLVQNAIEHGRSGEPIHVALRDRKETVELAVHNGGMPISPDILPIIFDPFIQGEPAARRSKGLGLGLFIAKAIAEAHEGTIRATSDREQGTTFTVTLPRKD